MLKCREQDGRTEVFDPIRKKWVAFTEEEKVRQWFVLFLMKKKSVPASHISIEREIKVNGLSKRYDIIVFGPDGKPSMVVECKAPHVKITQEVLEQVGRYNKTLQAAVIGVTNGTESRFFHINFESDEITMVL